MLASPAAPATPEVLPPPALRSSAVWLGVLGGRSSSSDQRQSAHRLCSPWTGPGMFSTQRGVEEHAADGRLSPNLSSFLPGHEIIQLET